MNHGMIVPVTAVLATGALALADGAQAAGQGDWFGRAGITVVQPKGDNIDSVGGLAAGTDAQVDIQEGAALGVTLGYFLTDSIAIELLASTPFSHDIEGDGEILGVDVDGTDVGEFKHLPPTLSIQYHFRTGTRWRPYIGAGINYTTFFDEDMDGDAEALGFDDLDLDDSWGPAAQVGIDYELGDTWLVNADIRYIDIDTDATLSGPAGDATADVEIDPWVFTLAAGFRF